MAPFLLPVVLIFLTLSLSFLLVENGIYIFVSLFFFSNSWRKYENEEVFFFFLIFVVVPAIVQWVKIPAAMALVSTEMWV